MLRALPLLVLPVLLLVMTAACSTAPPRPDVPAGPEPTADAATRAAPVVAGRPSRVFIMAGFEADCRPVPAPQITITEQPAQGDVSFVPGQETIIAASAQGTCTGKTVKGTGIYYTARKGASGSDRFSISAKLASGETAQRTFEVTIVE